MSEYAMEPSSSLAPRKYSAPSRVNSTCTACPAASSQQSSMPPESVRKTLGFLRESGKATLPTNLQEIGNCKKLGSVIFYCIHRVDSGIRGRPKISENSCTIRSSKRLSNVLGHPRFEELPRDQWHGHRMPKNPVVGMVDFLLGLVLPVLPWPLTVGIFPRDGMRGDGSGHRGAITSPHFYLE